MTKLSVLAFGGLVAAALGSAALAASAKPKVMNVPLPDGSVVRVQYVGEVAPRVTVDPAPLAGPMWNGPFAPLASLDRMIGEMNRRTQEMLRQAQQMAGSPGNASGVAPTIASFGNLPAGQASTTIVSVSNGRSTCTRTTEVVSQGAGTPPKVTSTVSGECARSPTPGAVSHST